MPLAGPPIARQLDGPILADVAYVGLKPVEYVARAFLGVLFERPMELAGMVGGAWVVAAEGRRECQPHQAKAAG